MATREPYCNHDPAAVNDEGVCECGEAVEGAALNALVLDRIAGLLDTPENWQNGSARWATLNEISALIRWSGRNGGPEPHEHYEMRAREA
jgi:hypothetical protein